MKKKPFSIKRVLLVLTLLLVVAGAIAYYGGYLQPFGVYRSANSMMVLMPYRHAGTWVFDDAAVGLNREPFVSGTPEIIDKMVDDIPDAEQGFRLLFSTQPFPDYQVKLVWLRGDESGNWYRAEPYDMEGWLCPGLFKYYAEAPKEIYAKAEQK